MNKVMRDIALALMVMAITSTTSAWAADKPKSKALTKAQEAPPQIQQAPVPPAPPPEKLVANAVICENAEDLALLSEDHFKGQSGDVVFKRVAASISFNESDIKLSSAMRNLATQEARVMADARWAGAGAKAGEAANYQSQESKAASELKRLRGFQERCTMASDSEEEVTVTEKKAISGLLKVKVLVKGVPADVWTKAEFMKPR